MSNKDHQQNRFSANHSDRLIEIRSYTSNTLTSGLGRSMKIKLFPYFLLLFFSLIGLAEELRKTNIVVPHTPRQGKNLIVNPSLKSKANWNLLRDVEYDASTSRTQDGSGSLKLKTPLPNASMALSSLIAVKPGQQFTFGFYFKTENGPAYVGAQISLHDNNKNYIRNHYSGLGGTTEDGKWQEFALPVTIPKGVSYIGLQVYQGAKTKPNGIVWADDFYLGEGLGLEQAPSPKKPFSGKHVRVDHLGNFEVKKKGVWTPFFPLCMYSDNARDWSTYSKQGWNTIIWASDASHVQRALNAKSEFNPDGMMAGFSFGQYTLPNGWAHNDLADLRSKLKEIFDKGLGENLLCYYWDNELHEDQWKVPVDVMNTIKQMDVDSSGNRRNPIFALQGMFNNARVHAARGLVDVSGTYVGVAPYYMDESLFILDRHEGQTSPAAFAQFNEVEGAGEMRLRLYSSIILGAKAMGCWRDSVKSDQYGAAIPVDKKPWWPDFPNLRREVDKLMPIIREAHWTKWKVKVDPPSAVKIGTRNYKGEAYLILVNQTTKSQTVKVTIEGLPYQAKEVRDFIKNKSVALVKGASFSLTLPKIGIGSGSKVLRLISTSQKP